MCDQDPRDSMFIRYDGTAAPCINLAIGGPTTFIGQDVTMPSAHYGSLPEMDLMKLWHSDTCKFYREQFKHRVEKHDGKIVDLLMRSGGSNPEKALKAARQAMPDPPKGCNVCHYLYDL